MSARNLDGRRRFPPRRHVIVVRAIVVVVFLARALGQLGRGNLPPPVPHEPDTVALVHRAVDGDTLLLADLTRVRLLGVDRPETKCPQAPVEPWGPEAHEFTRIHVEG